MSRKRPAEIDLNHDYWADENQLQQAGQFKPTSNETKFKAKRRNFKDASSCESLIASFEGLVISTGSTSTALSVKPANPFANISFLANNLVAPKPPVKVSPAAKVEESVAKVPNRIKCNDEGQSRGSGSSCNNPNRSDTSDTHKISRGIGRIEH